MSDPLHPVVAAMFARADALGWSDYKLAKRAGISNNAVNAWHIGRNDPRLEALETALAAMDWRLHVGPYKTCQYAQTAEAPADTILHPIVAAVFQCVETLGWTMDAFAARAGLSVWTVYNVRAGRTIPSLETLDAMLAAMDWNLHAGPFETCRANRALLERKA